MSNTVQRSIRFPVEDLEQIDQLAKQYGLNRTEFLIGAALGRLPPHMNRMDELEQRLQRLEERVDLSY